MNAEPSIPAMPQEVTTVFIVEDEVLIAMELEDRLTALGYRVLGTAARGEQALDAITAAPPDVVLMDVQLAGRLTGIETAAVLASRTDAPVIFISAFSDTELLLKAREVEPFGYIVKPFEERELHATIQMALYKHRMERALREANAQLERKIAEVEGRTAALLASEQRYSDLLEHINDAIIRDDLEGRLVYANHHFLEWFGLEGKNLRDIVLEDYVSPEWRALLRERHDRRVRGEQVPDRFEYEGIGASGQRLWLDVFVSPVVEQGRITGTQSVIRDITERKQAERHASRAQRLEAIGTLAGGIAHDLNNALTPILMTVDLLKDTYPDEAETLDAVARSAGHAAQMVRHLLSFARGTEGKRVSLRPQQLIEEIERIIKSTFPKNIDLRLSVPDGLPTVLGDATQLHQVLLNLCVNARDAMPDGGVLTLCVETVDADATFVGSANVERIKPGRYVVIRVTDTGGGIPAELLDRIFDPFFTTKGPERGTGLGLFTVAGIVKGHGGFVRVYSQPSSGSSFAVYLRAEASVAQAQPARSTDGGFKGAGQTVLYVDDEDTVREVASVVLRQLHVVPLIAGDGRAALALATRHRAELGAIITDLHMPNMDGLAFVQALRCVLPDIPIIVASGRVDPAVASELAKLGVRGMLDKPFTQAMLASALRVALGAGESETAVYQTQNL